MDNIVKIEIEVNATELAKEVYQNFPEYAISLVCTKYKYDDFQFSFYDPEDDKSYNVDLEKASKGVAKLIKEWHNRKCFFSGIDSLDDLKDPCNWDAVVVDSALQYAIFNELVYG